MIELRKLSNGELPMIHSLAHEIWPDTYGKILQPAQIDYMLELIYSEKALEEAASSEHEFFFIMFENQISGFIDIDHNWKRSGLTRIHKIYLRTALQGKGVGKQVIAEIERMAEKSGDRGLSLNVNRMNPAKNFYEKCGFRVRNSEDIDIGNGYLMEDFVMEKHFPG